jgi:hypothetical protein
MAPPSAAAGADEAEGRPQASAAAEAPARDPLWDFYACALEPDEGEDTEDELETQDWIRFERRRAQLRLAEACRREARLGLARAHK